MEPTTNWIGYIDTLLAYYLGKETAEMTDESWATTYAQFLDIYKKDRRRL